MAEAEVLETPLGKGSSYYRDEMNFAEFPLAAITTSVPKDQKTLVFKDEIFDASQRKRVERTLKITASDEYGLPTALDDEVIVGLIQLSAQSGFASKKVFFTRYELIDLLGWRDEGKSYERIEQSLKRWLGVTLYYNKAWWSKEESSWVDEAFHILEHLTLYDRERRVRRQKANAGDPTAGKSYFVWNDAVFRSFTAGYVKRLDFDLYKRLGSSIAKRMYRFLDKRFYRGSTHTFDLRTFACAHLGLSAVHHNGKLKHILRPAMRELEGAGFLAELPDAERFVRRARGEWEVVFVRGQGRNVDGETHPLARALLERGLSHRAAERLLRERDHALIEEKVTVFDQLIKEKSPLVTKNPAGFLYRAITEDYQTRGKPSGSPTSSRVTLRPSRPAKEALSVPADPVDALWEKMTPEERQRVEAEAVASASGFLRDQYEKNKDRGGTLFEGVKVTLVRAYLRTRPPRTDQQPR